MSFQDNKFPIALGAATAVAVGVLGWWGVKNSGKYDLAVEEYESAVSKIQRLTSGPAYPNAENRQAKEKSVAEYRTAVDGLQKAFDKYRVPEVTNIEVDTFTDALIASRDVLVEKFKEAGTELPEGPYLGLYRYTTEPAKKKLTGLLNYELDAFGELFGLLAEAGPKRINNFYRKELAEEQGEEFDDKGLGYRVHTVELNFTGSEDTMRDFLSALDESEKYFYSVRVLRVKNERLTAPNASDATFEQSEEEVDPADPFGGGGFAFPDEEELPEGEVTEEVVEDVPSEIIEEVVETETETEASSDSGEILKQVLGDENVQVFLCIDVLQFLEPKTLPKS